MIVIADTTPLNHLILIDQANILETLYGRVVVPSTVLSELQSQATPPKDKEWISNRPALAVGQPDGVAGRPESGAS